MRKYFKYSIMIIFFTSVSIWGLININHANFVSSKDSKYCYNKGSENKNMKVKIYYETLIDCGKPLKI